jgi:hypothetical protein
MAGQAATLQLRQAYGEFVDLIASLSDQTFLSSMDGWSPRDVAAHLVGWNSYMIEASISILAGEAPAYYEDTPNDYSHINARFTAQFSSRSRDEMLALLKSSMQGFEQFILALPAAELVADHGIRHHSGSPATVTRIIESLVTDYQYHTRQIRDWLDSR